MVLSMTLQPIEGPGAARASASHEAVRAEQALQLAVEVGGDAHRVRQLEHPRRAPRTSSQPHLGVAGVADEHVAERA